MSLLLNASAAVRFLLLCGFAAVLLLLLFFFAGVLLSWCVFFADVFAGVCFLLVYGLCRYALFVNTCNFWSFVFAPRATMSVCYKPGRTPKNTFAKHLTCDGCR